MDKITKLAVLAIAILGLIAIIVTACSGPSVARVGQPAPDFKLKNLEGESVSLSDFRGNTVLLNFWSTQCGPCVYELPDLQEIYDEWSDKRLMLLAINTGQSASTVNNFMEEYNLSLPVLLDTELKIFQMYNIPALPTTYFIDKEGIIKEKTIGFLHKEEVEKRLIKMIEPGD